MNPLKTQSGYEKLTFIVFIFIVTQRLFDKKLMKKKANKILIVEDNTLNLKLFRDILRAKGFETIEDRTGRHCLSLAEHHQPVLIILDVLLPFASGVELTHQLTQNPKTKTIPIVGVTALAISGTLDKMIESGCVDCLIKPFTLDQFLETVEQTIYTKKEPCLMGRQKIDQIKAELDDKSYVTSPSLPAEKNAHNQNGESVTIQEPKQLTL